MALEAIMLNFAAGRQAAALPLALSGAFVKGILEALASPWQENPHGILGCPRASLSFRENLYTKNP